MIGKILNMKIILPDMVEVTARLVSAFVIFTLFGYLCSFFI